jgi:hypothetical protein
MCNQDLGEGNMKIKFFTALIGFVGLLITASESHESPTLGQFLDAFPGVSNFASSKECDHSPLDQVYADVEGKKYEVR